MDLTLATPALLFPTISLLLLAYTNRFLALAALIRNLHAQFQDGRSERLVRQIDNLRRRLEMIRYMQAFGIISLFLCVLCMFLLFAGFVMAAQVIFGLSLCLLMASLGFSYVEIHTSLTALKVQLGDVKDS